MFLTWRAIGEKLGGTSPPFLRFSFSDSSLSSPSFCHHHHFVITIIVIAITVITILTSFSSLPNMGTRQRGQGRFSSLIIKRRSSPIHRYVEPPLIGLFSLLGQFDISDWQLGHNLDKFAQHLKSPPLTWHDRATTAQTASGTITRTAPGWLSLNRRVDLVILFWFCFGGMWAWELYGAWTDGSFP